MYPKFTQRSSQHRFDPSGLCNSTLNVNDIISALFRFSSKITIICNKHDDCARHLTENRTRRRRLAAGIRSHASQMRANIYRRSIECNVHRPRVEQRAPLTNERIGSHGSSEAAAREQTSRTIRWLMKKKKPYKRRRMRKPPRIIALIFHFSISRAPLQTPPIVARHRSDIENVSSFFIKKYFELYWRKLAEDFFSVRKSWAENRGKEINEQNLILHYCLFVCLLFLLCKCDEIFGNHRKICAPHLTNPI